MQISQEETEDIFLACRYGDLAQVEQFVGKWGADTLSELRDDNGSCLLHMVSANGHNDVLDYLLPIISPSLLSAQNNALSTPLHWAAMNGHLRIMQLLVDHPNGPGHALIELKNAAGRSPLAEAELAGFEEGAIWLVERMNLEVQQGVNEKEEDTTDVSTP